MRENFNLIATHAPRVRLTRIAALLACVALSAIAGSARTAAAFTYGDTLTTIWRPLVNIPAIHVPSETLTVIANAPSGATGWAATLKRGSLLFPLAPVNAAYDAVYQRWNLRYFLPPSAPGVVYDLIVTRSGAAADTARHAVRLLEARKTSWYFLQVSDTHLVTHLYYYEQGADTDTSEMADFQAVIDDINLINPEFVVHTGDIINEGELEEFLDKYYWARTQAKLSEFEVPFYLASGNHDIGGWDDTPPPPGTSRRNWWRYFGWPYLDNPPAGVAEHSQNYSFDYGPLRVIALEAYNNSGGYDDFEPPTYGSNSFTQEQLNWLGATVAATPAGMKKLAFYHYDFSSQINNQLAARGLDGVLWGHNHGVAEGNLAAAPFSLGVQSVCDGRRKFRLVRVAPNGTLTPRPMLQSGSTGQNLTLAYAPANNGANATVTATVTNALTEAFEHALVRFKVPDAGSYQVSAGTIVRQYAEGGTRRVEVNLPVPASGSAATTISPATGVEALAGADVASRFLVFPTSPNPVTGTGRLSFSLPREGELTIEVFDVTGRRVSSLAGRYPAGSWSREWTPRDDAGVPLGQGLYVLRFGFEGSVRTEKVVVFR